MTHTSATPILAVQISTRHVCIKDGWTRSDIAKKQCKEADVSLHVEELILVIEKGGSFLILSKKKRVKTLTKTNGRKQSCFVLLNTLVAFKWDRL